MIRFIISTTVKKRDVNGNCYNFSVITSTKTGETLSIDSGWGSDGGNIKHLLRKFGIEWEEIHYSESVVPAREYSRLKHVTAPLVHEHEVSKDMILDLEGVNNECAS